MKKILLRVFVFIVLILGVNYSYSQTCSDPIRHVWKNMPKIQYSATSNQYIALGTGSLQSYFNQEYFTMELMVKAENVSLNSTRIVFSIDNASQYNLPSFYIGLKNNGSNLTLVLSDVETNLNLVKNKWYHLVLVFTPSNVTITLNNGSSSSSSVYSRSSVYKGAIGSSNPFNIGHSNYLYKYFSIYLPKFSNLGGYVSGFRIWDKALTVSEINYVRHKTFKGVNTFNSSYQTLDSHLKVNLLTDNASHIGYYDQKNGLTSISQSGFGASSYSDDVPSLPISFYGLEESGSGFSTIDLEWSSVSDSATYEVYRKIQGQGDNTYTLKCTTNETNFTDNNFTDFGVLQYTYQVKVCFLNPSNPLSLGSSKYYGESQTKNAGLAYYTAVTGLTASTNLCDGRVKLQWNRVSNSVANSSSYTLECKIDGSAWQVVDADIGYSGSPVVYYHTVSPADYGKQITYRVDANGDNHFAYSSEVIGKANEICNSLAENLVASVVDNNISLEWDYTPSGPPVETFNIYRKKDTDVDFALLESNVPVTQTFFIDHDAAMCQTYFYKVSTVNSCGEHSVLSDASNSIYLTQEFDSVFIAQGGYFDASKGYFGDKVLLEWSTNPSNDGDINSFDIYRRKQSQSFSYLTSLSNSNAATFEDLTAEANVVYDYWIRAVGECGGSDVYSDTAEAIGFRVKTGIVAGNVSYAGGNAVPEVPVVISNDDETTQTSGNFENPLVCAYSDSFIDDSVFYKPFTAEMWIKTTNQYNDNQVCFSLLNGVMYLEINHLVPIVKLNQKSLAFNVENNLNIGAVTGDTLLMENQWYHVSVVVDPDSSSLSLYINSQLVGYDIIDVAYPWVDAINCDLDINSPNMIIGNGFVGSNTYDFQGQIDEIRIWQKARTQDEIAGDYMLLLAGNEPGLLGYYRLDENFGTSFYDLSKSNGEFHKNDFSFILPETYTDCWSEATPSFDQLHAGAKTNSNGNYTITGIRYSGSGSVFSVTPVYGVHVFNPESTSLYIGDGSPVQNGVNFIDQSSFTFTGTVYYSGTNVPVEGAKVYVDNVQQFDQGGYPIETNEFGQISVSVPIGMHYISVKKDGHVFENNGQWPHPTESEPYKKFNFVEDVNNITFYDSTRVVVCGRFVGGDVEGNKKPGFGLSKANIGEGRIVLSSENGIYQINNGETSQLILTDFSHGEYVASLLPIVYKIDSVYNDFYAINQLDLGLLDLKSIPEMTIVTDTVYTEVVNGTDTTTDIHVNTFSFHFQHNFIHYEEPTITIFNDEFEEFNGEKQYFLYDDDGNVSDTIDLVNNSPFRYPVFIMGNTYGINLVVGSVYTKYDELGDPIEYDTVPVANATINIVNNLEINQPSHSLTTNESGLVSNYTSFKVGLPNMNQNEPELTSYTKTMTITGTSGNFSFAWNGGDVYRAYVLGGVDAGGTNFITYGPEITQFILRDPPGDRSYTSLMEGSEYSSTQSYSFSAGSISDYDNVLMTGVKFEIGGGLAGPVFESEVQTDFNGGITTTNSITESGKYIKTYTFNETFSTSDSPDAVGSMADVYIGKSVNLFYTETNNLRIYPRTFFDESGNEHLSDDELENPTASYLIGKRPGFAVTDDPSSTMFIYTQNHILNNLLPSYKNLIYVLLTSDTYTSKIPPNHPYYGLSNDAEVWADTIAITGDTLPSYVFNGGAQDVDSIALLNQNIAIWLQTVALNEAAKVDPSLYHANNISFDGNAGAYTNELATSESTVTNKDYAFQFKVFGGATDGFNINGTGLLTYSQTYKNWDRELGQTATEQKTLKWKYVLDDSNQSDYFSVDILTSESGVWEGESASIINSDNYEGIESTCPLWRTGVAFGIGVALGKLINPLAGQVFNMANTLQIASAYMGKLRTYSESIESQNVYFGLHGASPVFALMGGQSRCPYEGEEYTAFYLDSVSLEPILLTPGTQNHEAPAISIEPAIRINVPEGEEAVFDLHLMNESPTGLNITYELLLDEISNPDGAIVKLDGLSPDRSFFIPAGQTITKTLTVEKGASGVMEYNDIRLILHSACQYNPENNVANIADTVSFSAHFIPTCTEAYFANVTDNWVVNVNNNNLLPLNVTGYNINQPTFQKIYVMYQQPGATPTPIMTLYNDTINTDWASFSGVKMYIDNQSHANFSWNTSSLNDGDYYLYLTTTCSDGSIYESEHLSGVIDRITPRAYGTPEPADGILSYGDDISVLFNENINVGELNNFGQYGSQSYISLRGVLNGTDLIDSPTLLHDASVHFDGENDNLKINNVNLDHTDFTIEFWAKRDGLGEANIINFGDVLQGGLWIGFNESDHFVIRVDGQIFVSENTYTTLDDWAFYSIAYDRGDESNEPTFAILILSGTSGEPQVETMSIYSELEGTMYVGYCEGDGTAFYGNIHELRIWNYARTEVEVASQKAHILNGSENGLYSLWPLTEAYGEYAKDIAFGRDAIVNATWSVSRNGKALLLDGSNSFIVPTSQMAFSDQANFTLEFWFKTPLPNSNATLFSNGDMNYDYNEDAWSVTATSNSQIIVSNNGTDVNVNAVDYLDNNWHHFAMSLNRIGYLNIYLDGNLVKTSSSTNFKGFASSQFVAGARWYNLSMVDTYDQYMTGVIDEIRIWNNARSHSQIERYKNYSLKGDEIGLKAYFPFEDVTIEDPSVSNESADNFTADTIGVANDASLDAEYFTSESPKIKLQRPEVLIPHNIVVSDNGVVISPNVDSDQIENQILDVSIKNVKDLHNNVMASSLTWSAFVDMNQVVWDVQELEIEKSVEEETAITVNIRNKGGLNETFSITNVPSWLEVSPVSGNLNPLEIKEIEIIVKPELNVGSYQRNIDLVSSLGYNEGLSISVSVNGNIPNWSVNPEEYGNTANIVGQLSIGNILSTDTDDIVACFVGNECRGVTNVEYFPQADIYLCFMSVYANSDGESLSFKVYDASTGEVFANVAPVLEFESDALFGNVNEPVLINATNYIDQNIPLNQGWNWISFNVYAEEFNDLNECFENLTTQPGDHIKAQSLFSNVNASNNWQGALNALDVMSSYKLNVENAQTLTVSGYRVVADTVQVPIVTGWNWIGYPLMVQKPLMEALSSLNPSENDIVKSQHQFAIFSDLLGWVGSLTYMQPGKGYILFSSSDGMLEYTSAVVSKNQIEIDDDSDLPSTEQNMTIIAELDLENPEQFDVFAYDENGVCGKAKPIKLADGRIRFFITLNSTVPETIRFEAKSIYGALFANEIVGFKSNQMEGSLDDPMILTFGENAISALADVYPNPFRKDISLNVYLNEDQEVQCMLYNGLGTEVSIVKIELPKGSHHLDLMKELGLEKDLSNGVYMLKLKYNGKEELIKIVKQ